ncbi:MAG: alpha/beta hydrolase [Candidatus Ornithospirochaeta sp.]
MAALFAFLIILLALFLGYCSSSMIFSYRTENHFSPQDGEEVFFHSGKNRLEGRIWNPEGEKGTILFSHGMGLSMDYYLPEINHLSSLGYTVFSYEYRGYGKSNGHFLTFFDSIEDLRAAFSFIAEDRDRIILMGHSMGAYATACLLREKDWRIDKAVLYAPFRTPFSAMHVTASWHGLKGRCLEVFMYLFSILKRGNKADYKALAGLEDPGVPVLLIQGDEDNACVPEGCALYSERAKFGKNVEVCLVSEKGGNGHNTILRPKGEKGINHTTMTLTEKFLS